METHLQLQRHTETNSKHGPGSALRRALSSEFVDFLRSCKATMLHIKALEILNDCNENRKILLKWPDWLTARWNRKVIKVEEKSSKFPSFSEFVEFLIREAKIACNPVTWLQSLKQGEIENPKLKDIKVLTQRHWLQVPMKRLWKPALSVRRLGTLCSIAEIWWKSQVCPSWKAVLWFVLSPKSKSRQVNYKSGKE